MVRLDVDLASAASASACPATGPSSASPRARAPPLLERGPRSTPRWPRSPVHRWARAADDIADVIGALPRAGSADGRPYRCRAAPSGLIDPGAQVSSAWWSAARAGLVVHAPPRAAEAGPRSGPASRGSPRALASPRRAAKSAAVAAGSGGSRPLGLPAPTASSRWGGERSATPRASWPPPTRGCGSCRSRRRPRHGRRRVGGKTAIDTARRKNLVGAFHPPAACSLTPPCCRRCRSAVPLGPGRGREVRVHRGPRVLDLLDAVPSGRAATQGSRARRRGQGRRRRDLSTLGRREFLNFGHTMGHAMSGSGFRSRTVRRSRSGSCSPPSSPGRPAC